MPNYGTDRHPIYRLFVAIKGRGGVGAGPIELTNVIAITTQKSIGDPSGAFEITLDGTRVKDTRRIYDLITPNDYVEIRLGVQPQHPTALPVMRGFVDSVRIVEDPGATPSRTIIIGGRDYGKAWLVVKLLNIYPPQTSTLAYLLKDVYAIDQITNVPLVDLFTLVMTHVVRPYILFAQAVTGGESDEGVKDFAVYSDIQPALKLVNVLPTQIDDPVYNWLKAYQNTPWIEMFNRDEVNGPLFLLRWARTRTSDFRQIDPFDGPLAAIDTLHTITSRDDNMADNLGRTDNDVYNWFFTGNAAINAIDQDVPGAVLVPGVNPYVAGDSIDRYALRKLHPNITFLENVEGQGADEIKAAVAAHKKLAADFNLWLVKMYGFNEQLENGTIMCLGRPDFLVGDEVVVADTGVAYYLEGVSHQFAVNRTYSMQLTVTRGQPYNGGAGLGVAWDVETPYKLPTTYPNLIPAFGLLATDTPDPGGLPTPVPR